MQEPKDREPYFSKGEVAITFLPVAILATTVFLVTLAAYVLTFETR